MTDEDTEDTTEAEATDVAGEPVEVTTGADAEETADEEATEADATGRGARERLEESADRAVDELDTKVIDILSWVLDTETRGRIYVYLRQHPWSTSEEVAEGTGLYPSTVREALAELAEEDIVERQKRESERAGNNPYEYKSIAPSDLVGSVVGRVQEELNTIFNMDQVLDSAETETTEPVQIEVHDESEEDED
ncbi:winged helix-turn-helix transcriptional regulator [Halodesulfurarchaeum formicicum]|uniref:TrmB family transcriptional regulator n=1 Tax=Halodesulfurarchaeum formicicum TaxID=1873524 RepID=A0A1J1AA66_9EURY|nr:winged helix-turn-helix transcriptional regulator [Halodesulfurarchaeum formicicum]APE95028.1 TrmB family transcriptional regulator [Halodesulfurarchaeum formicicum]